MKFILRRISIALLVAVTLLCTACAKQSGGDIIDTEGTTNNGASNPGASVLPNGESPDPNATASATPVDNSDLDGVPDPDETIPPKLTLAEYEAINSDVIGWLSVPNTNIDYPVVRCDNNEYYLRNSVEKKTSKSGAIFMDYRNADEYQQRQLIIYGHNMRNGTMFHDLKNYKLEDFFKSNKTITLTLNGKQVKYEVYAAFIAEVDKVYFIRTQFGGAEDFAQYMNQLAALSKFKTDVTIKPDDQVLTLATCSYEYDNSRFVVQARRVS
jgi:sortase B